MTSSWSKHLKKLLCLMNLYAVCSMHINVMVTVPYEEPYLFRKELIKPAIDFALESLEHKKLMGIDHYDFHVTYHDSFCSHKAALWIVEQYYDQCSQTENPHHCNLTSPLLLLGPVCNEPTLVVATFAEHWGVPFISGGSHVTSIVGGSDHFSTLISGITSTFIDLGYFIDLIFKMAYSGKRIILVAEVDYEGSATERECFNMMVEIETILDSSGQFEIDSHRIVKGEFYPHDFVRNLYHPEVVVMCASSETVREIMLASWRVGYAIAGKYDWFLIDLHHSTHYDQQQPWKRGDSYDLYAKNAYHALKVFTLRVSTEDKFAGFARKILQNYEIIGVNENVNTYVSGFHDAIILYAQALNKTLAQKKNVFDGEDVIKNMRNVTFEGISGPVSMNEHGQRLGSYSLFAMTDAQKGNYEKIIEFVVGNTKVVTGNLKFLQNPGKLDDALNQLTSLKERNSDQRIPKVISEERNRHISKTTMGGAIATGVAVLICCTLIVVRVCCSQKKCLRRSKNHQSVNNHTVDTLIPLQEDESATTCMTILEEDVRV